ncbi:MAG: ABC transporter permease [Magnetococcales bacterium]|nr:ABC transporter permease [Magnetococcales bacterium]
MTAPSPTSLPPLRVIEPSSGWRSLDWRELWAYRELLWVLTQRDLKVRYRQTVLGVLWAILQPLAGMAVFAVIFGRLAALPSDGYPYPVFCFAALLPWLFFSNAVSNCSNAMVGASQLVSKVYFPRLIMPLSAVGIGLVDFALSMAVLLLLTLWYGVPWSLNLLAVPFLTLAVIVTAAGVGAMFSALIVSYRDFRYVVPFTLQLWMYATPVVYPASLVPEEWQWLLHLNPLAGLVEGFRSAFLGKAFDWTGLSISMAVALLCFLAGAWLFKRLERQLADLI